MSSLPCYPDNPFGLEEAATYALQSFDSGDSSTSWIVQDLVPTQALVLVAGPPGGGKSWFLEDLALRVAEAKPFLGRFEIPAAKRVLFFDQDTPTATLQVRCKALWGRTSPPENLRVISQPGYYLDHVEGQKKIEKACEDFAPELVVFDTYASFSSGEHDENQTKDSKRITTFLNRIRCKYACTIILAHHFGKKDATSGMLARIRGSSALPGAMDVILSVGFRTSRKGKLLTVASYPKRVLVVPGFESALFTQERHGILQEARLEWVRDLEANSDPETQELFEDVMELVKATKGNGLCFKALGQESGGYYSDRDLRFALRTLFERGQLARGAESHNRFRWWDPALAPLAEKTEKLEI